MKNIFTGDGNTSEFFFTFPFFTKDDIRVQINGVSQTTGFALHPNFIGPDADIPFNGGRIDMQAPPPIGARVEIFRRMRLDRKIDYQPTERIRTQNLNQDFNFAIEALKDFAASIENFGQISNLPSPDEINAIIDALGDISALASRSDIDYITTALDDMAARLASLESLDIPVISDTMDYVVDSWIAADNSMWYRRYKSGWVEQGFRSSLNSNNIITTLPVPMANPDYSLQASALWGNASPAVMGVRIIARTPTTVTTGVSNLNNANSHAPGMLHNLEIRGIPAQ